MGLGRSKRGRVYVYTQVIHFVIRQKLKQHWKAIILHLKKLTIVICFFKYHIWWRRKRLQITQETWVTWREGNADYTNSEIPNLISSFVVLIFPNSGISGSVGASMCVCSVARSCPTFCDLMDCSLPGSLAFPRQGEWKGLPFSSPGDFPDPGIKSVYFCSSCIGRQVLYHWTTWEALK